MQANTSRSSELIALHQGNYTLLAINACAAAWKHTKRRKEKAGRTRRGEQRLFPKPLWRGLGEMIIIYTAHRSVRFNLTMSMGHPPTHPPLARIPTTLAYMCTCAAEGKYYKTIFFCIAMQQNIDHKLPRSKTLHQVHLFQASCLRIFVDISWQC